VTIDFSTPSEVTDLAARTAAFVRHHVIDIETRVRGVVHQGDPALRRELQEGARAAGVFCPQVSPNFGGMGLDMRGQAVVFEEAGYSLLGPLATNCAAPDEGNMHLLEVVGSEEQKQRYLAPLAAGDTRSCFAMTEPAPGAGADPRQLTTTATAVRGGWRIEGRKWFISGARGAAVTICMARTSGTPGSAGGATMFLVEAGQPGLEFIRDIDTMDQGLFAGHSELIFDNCVVPQDQVLGEVDKGFDYAQVRLAPARLTHCMRWLGIARRSQDIAIERASNRPAFGGRLADLGMVQQQIADSEIDIAAARSMIHRGAWELDTAASSPTAAQHSSMTKVFVAEAVWRVIDRSLQICGALGISEDILLSRYLRDARAFRIYDGPSETHRWAIARRAIREHGAAS
jgi:acyl-CoA dehydrogenase